MADETVIDEVFRKVPRDVLRKSLGTPDRPLSKQTMSDWKRAGCVPARHAVAVEKLTGIARERLCPGFEWGRKKPAAAAQTTDRDNGHKEGR